MAFRNVGVVTPRANVSTCRCIPGLGCICFSTQTNNIGVPPFVYPTTVEMPQDEFPQIMGAPSNINSFGT